LSKSYSKKILAIGAFIASVVAIFYWGHHLTKSENEFQLKISKKDYFLLTLSSEIDNINANLPIQLDQNTVLNSVSIKKDTIIFNHSIKSTAITPLTSAFINNNLVSRLTHQVCFDETKNIFLQHGVSISMDYFDPYQVLIFKFVVTSLDCDNLK